jgi:ribosomal protein L9
MFATLLCSAGMEMEPTASPRKTKLERTKTFDLFVSQGDDGKYFGEVLKKEEGTQVTIAQIIGGNA